MKHNHGTTSNTDEVFRTFIGCEIKGLVREITFEGQHANILVFQCGWGLALNSNGSHWTVSPEEIQAHLNKAKDKLEDTQRELSSVLTLAGE